MSADQGKKAVVLFNLGGPTSPESVGPFLYNLFSDPDIIRLPKPLRFLQKPLARRIASRRTPEATHNYELIGGKSPLLENTWRQARALESVLGAGYHVTVAMRYWEPRAEESVAALRAMAPSKLLLLPLYPQYSMATTASSLNDFDAALQAANWSPPTERVLQWHDRPGFAELVAQSINKALAHCNPANTHLLFSAHGLPVSYITKYGDPYQKQIEETLALVMKSVQPQVEHSLCFQSRVGPAKWLGPDIETTLRGLAQGNKKTVVVYPISFVSEHVETLYELDIQYGDIAKQLGLDYRRIHTLGDQPEFVNFLARLVRDMERP
jgi:ferrochelatase